MLNLNLFNIYIIFIFVLDLIFMFFMFYPSNLYKFHPLILSVLLIFYVIMLSFKLNFMIGYYWYSYILFLLMVGGLMILFMYFTSLSNNQLFYFNKNYYFYFYSKIFLALIVFLVFLWKFDLINLMYFYSYNELNTFLKLFELMDKDYYINMMMNYSIDLNMLMVIYLFIIMICSVMICFKYSIPLRQLNKKL